MSDNQLEWLITIGFIVVMWVIGCFIIARCGCFEW